MSWVRTPAAHVRLCRAMRRLRDNEGKDAGTERVEPLIYGVGPSIDYRSRMNLKVKVLLLCGRGAHPSWCPWSLLMDGLPTVRV